MTLDPIRNALLSAKHRQEQGEKHTRYEMGQMLLHAKSLCAHGEWYPFLAEAQIERSEANELMKWASYWQIAEIPEVFQLEPSGTKRSADQIAEISEVSLPTAHAQREFLRSEPQVKEVVIEKMIADPDAEIKAAEIRKLRAELAEAREELFNQPEPIVDLDKHRAMTQGVQFGAVIGTFMDNLMSYQLSSRDFLDTDVVARHDVRLRELQAMLERYFNPTIHTISPTTIDV